MSKVKRVSRLVLTGLLGLSLALNVAAQEDSDLCSQLRKLDWFAASLPGEISVVPSKRVLPLGEGELSDPRTEDHTMDDVISQLGALVRPHALSQELVSELKEVGEADFIFVHVPDTKLYYFGNTQGSARCSYNTWAVERGGILRSMDGPAFNADACDVNDIFGTFRGKSVFMQFGNPPHAPLEVVNPSHVSVAVADGGRWKNLCSIPLPSGE